MQYDLYYFKSMFSKILGKQPPSLPEVAALINPPEKIKSLEHLESLIGSKNCFSLVEKVFFEKLPALFEDLQKSGVEGDLLQAGVWKGGSALYLQALQQFHQMGRQLWLADTFSGFVQEEIRHEKDLAALAIFSIMLAPAFPTADDVKRLFRRAGYWNDQVRLMPGPLEKTITAAAIEKLCFIHIDVDFYEPTYAALALSYPKLEIGGYVVIDDYGVAAFNCKDAVEDYRLEHGIEEPITMMSEFIGYWKKENHV